MNEEAMLPPLREEAPEQGSVPAAEARWRHPPQRRNLRSIPGVDKTLLAQSPAGSSSGPLLIQDFRKTQDLACPLAVEYLAAIESSAVNCRWMYRMGLVKCVRANLELL